MTVDLSPILDSLIKLGGVGLMVLGGIAVKRLATTLGLQADGALANQLDSALDKAIAAGTMTAVGDIKEKGWDHPDVKNQVVTAGLEYLVRQWPGLLKRIGLDTGDLAETRARLTMLLNRAFPTAIAALANSPATPPVPPPPPAAASPQGATTA